MVSFNLCSSDIDKTSYRYHKARREAFSRWLSSAASRRIKKEVQDSKFKVSHFLNNLKFM